MKWLTGGERVRARFMRQDNFEFPRTWIVFLVTNYKPTIKGTDEGTWRRIRLVPWEISLPRNKQRPQESVVKTLLLERDGILQWLVEGLKDWLQDPHWVAEEVLYATETYREEEDILRGFLNECCEIKPRYTVEVGTLYEAYEKWCKVVGEEAIGKKPFGKLLRNRGITQKKEAQGVRKWVGIRIKQTPPGGNNTENDYEPENEEKNEEKNAFNAYNEAGLNQFQVANGGNKSISPYKKEKICGYTETLPPFATKNGLEANSEAGLNQFFFQKNEEEKVEEKNENIENGEENQAENNTENNLAPDWGEECPGEEFTPVEGCLICRHKERELIEYLYNGGMEVNYLSKRFNVSVGGLNTHLTSHRKAPPGEGK